MQSRGVNGWLAMVVCAVLACGGRQQRDDRGLTTFEQAVELHRRAENDNRRTRESLFDQARDKYRQACQEGNRDACASHDQLDAALKERRGECQSADECSTQGRAWLPGSRGEHRLRRLCLGERVTVQVGGAPPKWAPHGPSCVALGDFYRGARRARHAAYVYRKGCDEAGYAPACSGEAMRVLGESRALDLDSRAPDRGEVLRLAEPFARRGCDHGGAESCALLARVALARHRVRFPDVHSMRYSLEEADPKELLLDARAAADRGCQLGVQEACAIAEASVEELGRVTALLESGCAFLRNCGRGEVCNTSTGRCEGRGKKGGFYAAYDRGITLFDARDYDGANQAFEQARRISPHLPGPWRWLGLIALRQRRYADCVAATEEALRLNPLSKHALAMRALVAHCQSSAGR